MRTVPAYFITLIPKVSLFARGVDIDGTRFLDPIVVGQALSIPDQSRTQLHL